jgi:RNA polymerase sigma factor (sigma-70 family)
MRAPPGDDARLVARCLNGDGDAWAELVERYSRYVYAIATRGYGLRDHDAEDVFQEVFARTYEHLSSLRDGGALGAWIGQLTRRISIDRLRASSREEVSAEPPEPVPDQDPVARIETAMVVRDAMGVLPDHCREILDRFFARDQSYRTISEALGVPEGTIASRISRCLVKLRAELEGRSGAARPS